MALVGVADRHRPSSSIVFVTQHRAFASNNGSSSAEKRNGADKSASAVGKPSLWSRTKAEMAHYYHGFRLFGIELRISGGLLWRTMRGNTLTRREYRQLVRSTADVFRLMPFMVFIIVPFMEILLPVAIRLFPQMLPSTFETKEKREADLKRKLKVKMEMAKFLQDTLEKTAERAADRRDVPSADGSRAVENGGTDATAAEFMKFMSLVRETGDLPKTDDIIRFSKLFSDDITLDNLSRQQLVALCRLLEIAPIGTEPVLRFQIRTRMRTLKADDLMIRAEGVNTLTQSELITACKTRGMRVVSASEDRLRQQLSAWLELSLNEHVPISLLLISRTLYVPASTGPEGKILEVMRTLPERSIEEAEVAASESEGRTDYATKAKLIREEQELIVEERKRKEAADDEETVDKAPTITSDTGVEPLLSEDEVAQRASTVAAVGTSPAEEDKPEMTKKDYASIGEAIQAVIREKDIIVEKEDLKELKDELDRLKYVEQSEVEEIVKEPDLAYVDDKASQVAAAAPAAAPASSDKAERTRRKAAKRLRKRVDSLVQQMSGMLDRLNVEKERLEAADSTTTRKSTVVKVDELSDALRRLMPTAESGESESQRERRVEKIMRAFTELDIDHDGEIDVEHLLKVLTYVSREPTAISLNAKQLSSMLSMLEKEEFVEEHGIDEFVERIVAMDRAESQSRKRSSSDADSTTTADDASTSSNVEQKRP